VPNDRRSPAPRRVQDRLDDHAAIDHLADDLLPALVAKLGASGLGELEIREGTWRVRLRMPADGSAVAGRRPTPGRAGSRAGDGPHPERTRADAPGAAGTGTVPGSAAPVTEPASAVGPSRVVATSPAVGYFRPRNDLRAGTKVRAGDRIGSVDVLGIGQDLVAPGDGLIGATLVASGEPVEYGQAIIVLEQLGEPRSQPGHAADADVPIEANGVAAGGPTDATGAAARMVAPDALPAGLDAAPPAAPDAASPAGAD
jgi:acetyl-CoA carboxylase biotin carboxyl carrier protein